MISRFVPFLLSLALCLASVGTGMARLEGGLSRQIEICNGAGVSQITLDARGNPVSPSHHCPSCLVLAVLGLPPAAPGEPLRADLPLRQPFAELIAAPGSGRLPPKAQGPPVIA